MRSGCRGGRNTPTPISAYTAITALLLGSPTAMAEPFASITPWPRGSKFRGSFQGKLAAIRFPEIAVVFDDGAMQQVEG